MTMTTGRILALIGLSIAILCLIVIIIDYTIKQKKNKR